MSTTTTTTKSDHYTIKQVAAIAGMSERFIAARIASGELPSYKLGGSRRIDKVEWERYLERHHHGG